MDLRRCRWVVFAALALQGVAMAQEPAGTPTSTHLPPLILSLMHFPAPYDPLELVPDGAQPVQNAEDRAATIELLTRARDLSNVRLHPYDLKTTFSTYTSSSSDGRWSLEDTSPSRGIYRWTAQGPSFSGVFLTNGDLVSTDRPSGGIPLRLAQVREAIFWIYPGIGRYASLRVATASLDGTEVRCILVAHGMIGSSKNSFSSGRSFQESEYCVNPKTGLLATYSPVPGLYVRYDYGNALHFHEETIPNGFTITESGRAVIEAKTESVTASPDAGLSIFKPEGLTPLGVGPAMEAPMMIRSNVPGANASPQVVVVHGMVTPDGRLDETEVLASTDASLNDAAVSRLSAGRLLAAGEDTQPGTTPISREVIFTVEFLPHTPCANGASAGGPCASEPQGAFPSSN
jgi:hypothetical protein